jgi:hypothetical protein
MSAALPPSVWLGHRKLRPSPPPPCRSADPKPVGCEAGLCTLGFGQDGAQGRLLLDPAGHEPHFMSGVLGVGDQQAAQAVAHADLKILLVPHSWSPFRAWSISRSTTRPAFWRLPAASMRWMRVRQHGQRIEAWTTISAQVTHIGYWQPGQPTSRSAHRNWVASDSATSPSCPGLWVACAHCSGDGSCSTS